MRDNLVQISNLHFTFNEKILFNGLNLAIPRGKITAIMGPSGTGKTTLLRLIAGQLTPSKGSIILAGENVHTLSQNKLYRLRRNLGFLFQSGALFTNLNVFENVAFPLREHTKFPEALIRYLVLMKLEVVGLRGARDLMPNQLSGGMARRVALARALALDPQLMVYDEPFTGLDPISLGVIVKLIHQINNALGLTSIIVSHNVQEVSSIADYVYIISEGKIIGEGSPVELGQTHAPAVMQFMHGLADGVVPFHYPAKQYVEDLFQD